MIVTVEENLRDDATGEIDISVCSDREHPCPEVFYTAYFEIDPNSSTQNNFRENLMGVHDIVFFMQLAYEAGKRGEQFKVIKE